MAIYYLGVKSFGRSAGSKSTRAAAYRSGEKIRDERSGDLFNHSQRRDIEYKEIVLPAGVSEAASGSAWAADRGQLWNMAEHSESKSNARVAREYIVALPHELNAEQRTLLARSFAQEISDRHHNVVDLAVHQPRTDQRNFHAHLLTTTREVWGAGLGPKTIAELSGSQRFEQGLPGEMQAHAQIRGLWSVMANDALREAGLEVRISPFPDEEAILRPGAKPWLPRVAWQIERRGGHSYVGDNVRAEFAQRREAALARSGQPSASIPTSGTRKTPEEMRKQAIEDWQAIRTAQRPGLSAESRDAPTLASSRASRQSDVERQIESLHRELGRDDFSL